MTHDNTHTNSDGLSRRRFIQLGAAGGAAIATTSAGERTARSAPAIGGATRPNILFITTDQQGLDTLSAYGCADLHTPNLDRLASRGVSFMESHTTNPLCSPARSSLFTGRMPSETGVIKNGLPIRDDIPNMGQWLGGQGYDTYYFGKWHVPLSYVLDIPGFTVIPCGNNGHGSLLDASVSRACQGFLRNRTSKTPFLMVASFLQPHDICSYVSMQKDAPDVLEFPEIEGELPPLPPNFEYDPREPKGASGPRNYQKVASRWSERQWRLYIWNYYRMVEEVDAEVGRVLQALEDSGHADNTIVVFTSDHGEGRARHQTTQKNFLYEEALKVPLIVSCPGRLPEGTRDTERLVSGIDVMPTICDFAGAPIPKGTVGASLRPALEERGGDWREFAVAEVRTNTGRAIRTADYKLVTYSDDTVSQLFDMKNDPGETKNLSNDPARAGDMAELRRLLEGWESCLDPAPNARPAST